MAAVALGTPSVVVLEKKPISYQTLLLGAGTLIVAYIKIANSNRVNYRFKHV